MHKLFIALGISLIIIFAGASAFAVDVQISQLLDSPDPAVRAGQLTYSIFVQNGDPDTAGNVVLSLPLPATTTFESVSGDAGCSHDGGSPGTVTCNFGSLAGPDIGGPVKQIDVVIRTTGSTGGSINVTASVSTTSSDTNPANDSLSQNTTINDGSDLTASISDSPDPVTAGGYVDYSIVIANQGPNNASTISVANTLPTNTTYDSASGTGWSCSAVGQVVTCTRAALNSGATAPTISVSAQVTGAITGTITDTVTVSAATGDPDANNNTETEDTEVNEGTDLFITKIVFSPVIGGNAGTFRLRPRNNGPFPAQNLTVTDTVPAGFTITGASGTGWSCNIAGQDVTCTRDSYAVSAIANIDIQFTAPASGSGITNSASLSSTTADPDMSNNSGSVTFSIVPDGADLSINKSKTPNPVAQGSSITNTLSITNNGPRATSGIETITDTLPAGETYDSFSGTNWSCSEASGVVTCTYTGVINSGATSSTLTITTTAAGAGALSNTACASDAGGQPDGVSSNDCISRSVTSTALIADITITKSATTADADTTLLATEDTITYSIDVINNGPDASTGIVMTDPIAGYVSGGTSVVVSVKPANYSCSTGSTVTCTHQSGSLLSGGTDHFEIEVSRPLYDGSMTNTASAYSSDIGDNNRNNNTAQSTVIIDPVADVQMQSKTVSPNPVKAGTEATYVLTFRNNGPSTAAAVEVIDDFTSPGGGDTDFTFISATPTEGSCSYDDPTRKITCTGIVLSNGESRTVTVKIRPNWQAGDPARTINNTASISTTTYESNGANNTQTGTLSVTASELDMLVNKTDLSDPIGYDPRPGFEANNVITYKVDITNMGPSLATGVTLSDVMSPKNGKTVKFLCDKTASGDDCTGAKLCDNINSEVTGPASLTITCSLSNLAASASVTRYLDFQVMTAPDSSGDTHTDSATIQVNEADTLGANDTENETTTVRKRVDLSVSKSPSSATVQLREPFNWTILVTNNGPGDSETTTLTDTLPSSMAFFGAAPSWSNNNAAPASGTCSTSGSGLTCNLGLLESTKVATITVTVRVTSYPGGGTLQNCATATTSEVDPISGNNTTQCGTVTVQRSSLAGTVYRDLNNSGSINGGEAGISGVQTRITGTDAYGNAVNTTQTTDGSGNYSFNDLSPSDATGYTVVEVSQPANYFDGKDTPGSNCGTASCGTAASVGSDQISGIQLAGNTAATVYIFGELPGNTVNGFVYYDADNDGLKDAGETGIQNVTVTLTGTDYGPDGVSGGGDDISVNQSTITDINGWYEFTGLRAGAFRVTETQPSGYLDGLETAGTVAGAACSGCNTSTNDQIGNIVISNFGDTAADMNFGDLLPSSLSGKVYNDANNNGAYNAGESGIAGVTLTLTGTNDLGAITPLADVTDASGNYSFSDLRPGTYTITETQLLGFLDASETVGTVGGVSRGTLSANDVISSIALVSDEDGINYYFGERGSGITGSVYVDSDNDGVFDGSEDPVADVTVRVTGTDADGIAVDRITTTGVDGSYTFYNLPASNTSGYTVNETQPAAWADGKDTAGTAGGSTAVNDNISGIVITVNTVSSGNNFGEVGGSLSGTVFYDVNNNGTQDTGDIGIQQVTLTLTGTAVNGDPVSKTATTDFYGRYQFTDLPLPNGSGFTISETQPDGYDQGIVTAGSLGGTVTDDDISAIAPGSAGADGTGYNFAERLSNGAQLSGRVWFDANHNRIDDESSADGRSGWSVEMIKRINPTDTSFILVAQTTTDANGNYQFNNLMPNNADAVTDCYEIRFRHPSNGAVYGTPVSSEPGVDLSFHTIRNLQVSAGDNIQDQSLPLDPGGVVYDSVKRTPLSGAVVVFSGPAGFDPGLHLVGGSGNISQTTGDDGIYQYLLFSTAPAGTYTITVTPPAGYLPFPSTMIPACTSSVNVEAVPGPSLVQNNNAPPVVSASVHNPASCAANSSGISTGANSTQYYVSFILTPGVSANIVNNHIPIDPILGGAIVMQKTTPLVNVKRGELVPYTITATNTLTATLTNINIIDQVPPGFKYIEHSAVMDGVKNEPVRAGRDLTWSDLTFAPREKKTIKLILVVGSGVGEGEYTNKTWAINNIINSSVSNIAEATVRVVPDPVFDCSDIIGKVFDDSNANGYQDEGEPGIPNVRIATARGLLVTTDSEGRFHVPCADVPNPDRGANFIMKLDERTLPSGFRLTTENPRDVRVTRGKMVQLNFGAAIHRVVRIELSSAAFEKDKDQLLSQWREMIKQLPERIEDRPSVVRIVYRRADEDMKMVRSRINAFHDEIADLWASKKGRYLLIIEEEIEGGTK